MVDKPLARFVAVPDVGRDISTVLIFADLPVEVFSPPLLKVCHVCSAFTYQPVLKGLVLVHAVPVQVKVNVVVFRFAKIAVRAKDEASARVSEVHHV